MIIYEQGSCQTKDGVPFIYIMLITI